MKSLKNKHFYKISWTLHLYTQTKSYFNNELFNRESEYAKNGSEEFQQTGGVHSVMFTKKQVSFTGNRDFTVGNNGGFKSNDSIAV